MTLAGAARKTEIMRAQDEAQQTTPARRARSVGAFPALGRACVRVGIMLRRGCATLLALVAVLLAGCSDTDEAESAARDAAQAYLDAWASGDLAGAANRTDDSAAALLSLRAIATSMGFGAGRAPLSSEITAVELSESGGGQLHRHLGVRCGAGLDV